QKDICFASIEDGVISVATTGANGMEGQSNCRTLEELLESLDPNLFWRAHRSYLVNMNRIKEVVPWFKSSYQLRMDDKKQTEIPVSRAQTRKLRELFGLSDSWFHGPLLFLKSGADLLLQTAIASRAVRLVITM